MYITLRIKLPTDRDHFVGPPSPRISLTRVARVLRGVDECGEDAIAHTAELTGLEVHHVRAVDRYCSVYRDEIDAWIDAVDEEADSARR